MNRRPFLLLLLLPLSLLLLACQAGNPYHPVPKELALTVRAYEALVRWGDLRQMDQFVQKDVERAETQPNFSNIRVTGYDATTPFEIEPGRWGQTAVINYVLVDQQIVRELVDQQIWVSEGEEKSTRWFLERLPPAFD